MNRLMTSGGLWISLFVALPASHACGFINDFAAIRTFRLEAEQSSLVVYGTLETPSASFMLRMAGLRAARYFHNTCPDVIGKKALVEAIKPGLRQGDFADLVVEELRRWRSWDLTDRILPLYSSPSENPQAVRRAVLRYAMRCPDPKAVKFIAERRKEDPQVLAEAEELLLAQEKSP